MRTTREQAAGRATAGVEELAALCRDRSLPLERPVDLDPLMERIGDARFVLLGEASHGTSEYYVWRSWITRRLIQEKGFNFVAVEGDWPDCYRVNRYVKGRPGADESARQALHAFERWPTWMWGNWEVVALAEWLRKHNEALPEEAKVGFYGLDVYSLWESMESVIRYLEETDGDAAGAARRAYRCFEPYADDAQDYAMATMGFVPKTCEKEAVAMLTALRRELPAAEGEGLEAHFVAEQNALVVKNAETYYRTMIRGGGASWNVRDHHMMETLERLTRFHGPDAKAVIWEHNTHVGDARATDMAEAGMVNVGQLARERRAREGVVLIGFGSYEGSVIAGSRWGAPMRRMELPPARPGSWEAVLRHAGEADKMLLLTGDDRAVPEAFMEARGHRAVGVVYEPEVESWGNYVPTVLPARYDAFLYVDNTRALHPLRIDARSGFEPPDTYPWNA